MTYATATELLERFDAAEIAQRVDRQLPRMVSAELLKAAAAGNDLSGYTPEEAARAAVCLMVVQRSLRDADDAINSYLSGRYRLPLQPVPEVLSRVACELARYYLFDDQVTEVIKTRHDANIKWLGEVARGTVSLGAESASGEAPASGAAPEVVSAGRVWARDKSEGFL